MWHQVRKLSITRYNTFLVLKEYYITDPITSEETRTMLFFFFNLAKASNLHLKGGKKEM